MNRTKVAKWIYKLVSGRELLEPKNVTLLEIEPDAELHYDALGITEERAKELEKHLYEIRENEKSGKTSKVMVEFSKHCKHQNELALGMFILGIMLEHSRSNPFLSILNALRK